LAVFAIGDVQGAYSELQQLLSHIEFGSDDQLWFVGDLVNRGPQSLDVLRFVRDLGARAVTVLGNHDLHLLAIAAGTRQPGPHDSFRDVLAASDCDAIIDWLRRRPLLHDDAELGFTMVHAGLAPQWDRAIAKSCAAEVEAALRGDQWLDLLRHMYGSQPDLWSVNLHGWDRLRFNLNCLTRLRFCDARGRLHLKEKGPPYGRHDGLIPWFDVPNRANSDMRLVFGHWSTLGRYEGKGIYALDSGCIWGGALTAMRLDNKLPAWYGVPCAGYCVPGEE
jgi:bis(5'-nucleosyl)-tetraphosphatase (symmetrical)